MHHRIVVSLFWLVMMVAGVVASGQLTDRWSLDFSLPGQPGDDAENLMIENFGTSTFDSYIATVTVPEGDTVNAHRDEIAGIFKDAATIPNVHTRLVDFATTGDDSFIAEDGRTTFALIQGPIPTSFAPDAGYGDEILASLDQVEKQSDFTTGVTSYGILSSGEDTNGPSVLAETLLGAAGALLVLIFVFASFLALVPMMIAAVSILTCFLLVLGLTTFTDVSFVVQFLIALIGLGVAIDYSLLLVSRWREEREHGHSNEEAVVIAMKTAGHAVFASGVTVAISLIALVIVPVPFLRSMGFGGMFIPLVSVAVVLTLLPAMLSKIGPRVDWPRVRHEGRASRGWTAWARGIVAHRWAATGVAVVLLALLIAPVSQLKIGQADVDSLAKSGPAYETLQTLENAGFGDGVLTPIEVLVSPDQGDAAVQAASGVDGVQFAVVGAQNNDLALIDVFPQDATLESSSISVVDDVRNAVEGSVSGEVWIGGAGAAVGDYFSAVYDRFPYVMALIALITFVLLARTFRSWLLPLKAVILNLVSLAAVFGAIVFFWQLGHGSEAIFGISATGAIAFWEPVIIFAFLFGLSMDYEVFILARMREEYDATGDTKAAVITGIGRTGRLVTSAALILFFAFSALASSPGTDIKVMGTALGVGILIDATIVRALLVPALVSLFGAYNWWLPEWMARVLRVEPSPLVREQDRDRDDLDDPRPTLVN
ncbi:MAG TPA: MMPL family transporter [Nocardioidaceae bacterium]|nr:MMPL family transporter [Nocardioidaceae bacterium]